MILPLALAISLAVENNETTLLVTYPDGRPASGATIWIERFNGKTSDILLVATVSIDGKYSISLEPGEYAINVVRDRCEWHSARRGVEITNNPASVEIIVKRDVCGA